MDYCSCKSHSGGKSCLCGGGPRLRGFSNQHSWPMSGRITNASRLRGLMGVIPAGLPAVDPGAQYAFGFNASSGLTTGCALSTSDMVAAVESLGYSYNTTISQLSNTTTGAYFNPFYSMQGYSGFEWNSGTDFVNALYQALISAGCTSLDPTTIQFCVQPSGQTSFVGNCPLVSGYSGAAAGGTGAGQTATNAGNQAQPSPNCPPGYQDSSFLGLDLFGPSCKPIGQNGSSWWTALGLGAGGGIVLLGGGLLLVMAMSR